MVLILMILLSKHIVRLFSENYEKQKRFITDAGHEIKTPITIINADTEVLEMDTGPNEWIDDIRVQTERLSHLTKDLIYLARIEEGENQTQMIEFPLSELISETAVSFQAPARKDSDRFYRMDASRNSETGGYGIGLSIAHAVVQMHKGTISVTAVGEHKIQFTVLLPIRSVRVAK